MADAKKILVIDDHFEMLEFLRSMLELSGQDYEVLAVPSAEEGLLELRRATFDLLITDARLPGMSGFDLVRRLKTMKRTMPVIMITAYSTSQGQKEAAELGVYRYFGKPLDTDTVLTAVYTALYGEPTSKSAPKQPQTKTAISEEVRKKLDLLRGDTGASCLILSTVTGAITYKSGDERKMDLAKLATIISRNVEDSFLLAEQLGGSDNHFTIQYHAGDIIELYCASVGRNYFLALFYDIQSRRGRIGTIWVFTQRAIKDLMPLLPAVERVATPAVPAPSKPQPVPPKTNLVQPPLPKPITTTKPEEPAKTTTPKKEEKKVEPPPVAETKKEVTPTPKAPLPEKPAPIIQTEAAAELAELFNLDLSTGDGELNLDAFWDDVLTEDETKSKAAGLSLEEAQKRGLVGKLDPGEK